MVWFECGSCGDNFKKPKLVDHIRRCRSSFKISCLDCGVAFDRDGAQGHTQCVSEAEKYGPKGAGSNIPGTKKNQGSQICEELVNHGLSTRAPWACELCNVRATSWETLLVHGRSKRHGSKARAAFAAAGMPIPGEEKKGLENGDVREVDVKKTLIHSEEGGEEKADPKETLVHVEKGGEEKVDVLHAESGKKKEKKRVEKVVEITSETKLANGEEVKKKMKKRKAAMVEEFKLVEELKLDDPEEQEQSKKKTKANGVEAGENENKPGENKKRKAEDEAVIESNEADKSSKQVKWRKLVSKQLKLSDGGKIKLRELQKVVVPLATEAGATVDSTALKSQLRDYISSSSKFVLEGKYVGFA